MASTKDFKNFILEQLSGLNEIQSRPMMGEFLLYYNGILFGGIYDDRLLIKKAKGNEKYNLNEQIPYKTTRPMLFVENLDDREYLAELIKTTCDDLKANKKMT